MKVREEGLRPSKKGNARDGSEEIGHLYVLCAQRLGDEVQYKGVRD